MTIDAVVDEKVTDKKEILSEKTINKLVKTMKNNSPVTILPASFDFSSHHLDVIALQNCSKRHEMFLCSKPGTETDIEAIDEKCYFIAEQLAKRGIETSYLDRVYPAQVQKEYSLVDGLMMLFNY